MNQLNNIVYLGSIDNSFKKITYEQTDEYKNILDGKIVPYKCRKYEIPKRHKYLINNRSKSKKNNNRENQDINNVLSEMILSI
jgi:hypothetical protein